MPDTMITTEVKLSLTCLSLIILRFSYQINVQLPYRPLVMGMLNVHARIFHTMWSD